METKSKKNENEEKGNLSSETGAKIHINDLHEKLGHPAEEMVKLTGNYMKLSIRGKMENCENCKKNRQNRDFVFTSTLHYQNSLVLEDLNIGFWQWMKLHIWNSVCSWNRKVTSRKSFFRSWRNCETRNIDAHTRLHINQKHHITGIEEKFRAETLI